MLDKEQALLLWLWLAAVLGPGAENSGTLLAACPGGAKEVFARKEEPPLRQLLSPRQRQRLDALSPEAFSAPLARAAAMELAVLAYDDPRYSLLLKNIHNPPPILYVAGDVSLLNGWLAVAVVGTRRPSAYGVDAVKVIVTDLAKAGIVVVSGLAAGLDSQAHKAALAADAPTVACLAFSHDECYPANHRALMDVIRRNGALVSEYPPGTGCEKPYFLQRNRLIAGLSHALVVAEARPRSGTISTVNFAADYGRDVFAVPGSIFSELSAGTNALIREGAFPAASAADILSLYNLQVADAPPAQRPPYKTPASFGLPPQDAARRLRVKNNPLAAGQSAEPAQLSLLVGGQTLPPLPAEREGSAAEAVLETPVPEVPAPQPGEQASAPAEAALSALTAQPQPLEAICKAAGLSHAAGLAALTELELLGRARQLAGRQFCAV